MTIDEKMKVIRNWGYHMDKINYLPNGKVSVFWKWKNGPMPSFSRWQWGTATKAEQIVKVPENYRTMDAAINHMYHRVENSIWDSLVLWEALGIRKDWIK